jgi:hypothetical protein
MEEYYEGLGKFSSHTKFEMGDGSKVRFWHDMWCEDMTLKEAYPNLYGIACIKDVYVAIHLELYSGSI